ncbi:CCR4-NOT transcription complex subunit 4 [Trichonephila clavata]|uniref:CCR4-NOT transcription complex subunit 4 n=1 Tax=Trichonephila clavata TaxID=2740835 RepID=A0A8X6G9Q5_TRICU|nr:CCR4-NOT transcription complex subunit 4 [Trichonephila clavata]
MILQEKDCTSKKHSKRQKRMSVNKEKTCPLCLETLDIDDLSFYPCKCGYQVCRFCWHRIRTNENGLCPACRRQYSEDPVTFKPLTQEE